MTFANKCFRCAGIISHFQACSNHNFKNTQSLFFTPCSRDTHSQLIPRKILVDIILFLAQKFDGRIPALLLYTQTQSETFFKDVSSKCSCYEPSGFGKKILLSKKTLPKAQRTRGLSSSYQSNFFRSYHRFLNKS